MHNRVCLALVLALQVWLSAASAYTVPVFRDTYSTNGTIVRVNGKSATLPVSASHIAYVAFDLADPAQVPGSVRPNNLQDATLRLYVVSSTATVANGGDVQVYAVTSDWDETFAANSAAAPTLSTWPVAVIPAAALRAKSFVEVSVTAQLLADLQANSVRGFALHTLSATASIKFASKEGPATGAAAELDLIVNSGLAADGTFTLPGPLVVSSAFVVEARPNNSPDLVGANLFAGLNAGANNTTGSENSFLGFGSGSSNVNGGFDTFFGYQSGGDNTSGSNNTFIGQQAGLHNTTGTDNTAIGGYASPSVVNGSSNVSVGAYAAFNSIGDNNVSLGRAAAFANTTGSQNVVIGTTAANKNTTGSNNIFIGQNAGNSNVTGSHNTVVGDGADTAANLTNATAIGSGAVVTASNSLVLGNNSFVGIGTSAPNSTLQVNGSLALHIRTIAQANAFLDDSDSVLICNPGTSTVVLPVTLPALRGRVYFVKNRSNVAIQLGSANSAQTVDGAASISIAAGTAVQLITDGTVWYRIN